LFHKVAAMSQAAVSQLITKLKRCRRNNNNNKIISSVISSLIFLSKL